jgi:hypothetical protein
MFTFDWHSNLVDGKRHHVVDIILVNLPLMAFLLLIVWMTKAFWSGLFSRKKYQNSAFEDLQCSTIEESSKKFKFESNMELCILWFQAINTHKTHER